MVKCSGQYFERNAFGYFKARFMCLINKELYLYKTRTSSKPTEILILTPGVYVTAPSKFHLLEA